MIVANHSYTWKRAYEGFATHLLKYKDKQKDLYDAIVGIDSNNVLPDALNNAIKDNRLIEFDPFTVIGLFNRHWDDNKRNDIFTRVCQALSFTPPNTIEGFSGVPVPGHGKEVFLKDKKENNTHKKLWNLFKAAIDLADASSPNKTQRESFISSYNAAIALKDVRWNLSMALFWIRPDYYLTLDTNVLSFLSDAKNVPEEEIAMIVSKWVTPPQGEQYLSFLDKLKDKMPKDKMSKDSFKENYGYSDFVELSDRAFEASQYSDVIDILEHNGQIILHGAPGTGKTYMAKEIAEKVSGDKGHKESTGESVYDRIRSVQFHPGYDYSDFIVGLKPKLVGEKDKEQVAFEWRSGVFKEFAKEAQDALDEYAKGNDDKVKHFDKSKPNAVFDPPKFVFIIDEINRADLSNVFGEVFSLSEREYRYRYEREKEDDGNEKPDGKMVVVGHHVDLPSTVGEAHEKFSIPSNLYIIGTMNDIDRSVESIDFALRRRFAWYEVSAKKTMNSILDNFDVKDQEKLKKAMIDLNVEISKPDYRLGMSYELGAAYFAKLQLYKSNGGEYNNSAYISLWNNHIKTILQEYLRGQDEDGGKMTKFENIYCEAVGIKSSKAKGKVSEENKPTPSEDASKFGN